MWPEQRMARIGTVMLGCLLVLGLSSHAPATDEQADPAAAMSVGQLASFAEPRVALPPTNPKIYGRTMGEWSGEWWNWVFQFPLDINPLFAEGDIDCGMEQSGRVWFLSGNGGGTNVRNCTIPVGKALFFPIHNTVWWAPEDAEECAGCAIDSDPADCPPECELALRGIAFSGMDTESYTTCTVDDVPCVYAHILVRTQSPGFVLSLPEEGFLAGFGVPVGDRPVAVSDGTWALLPPLPAGEHTIRFTADTADFQLDVTYNLTVVIDGD